MDVSEDLSKTDSGLNATSLKISIVTCMYASIEKHFYLYIHQPDCIDISNNNPLKKNVKHPSYIPLMISEEVFLLRSILHSIYLSAK